MSKKNKNRLVSETLNEDGSVDGQWVREETEEQEQAEAAPVETPETPAPKVQFDGWHALRSPAIPAIHKKEILKADFKGRKVPMEATMAEFDEALKKYGITL